MLLKIKQLIIEHSGYKREITAKDIYINSSSIISIADYSGADNFLLTENSNFSGSKFSLVKVNHGNETGDIIAFGSAATIYSSTGQESTGAKLLND